MGKKILVLGTGNAQVDITKYCKENGYEVFACSNARGGNAEEYVDHFSLINITDVDEVEKYAKSIEVDIVYSVGSDVAMPTVCEVSKRLALPVFVDTTIAEICNTKTLLREALGNDFYGNVGFQRITSKDEKINVMFPAIMKPVDSQGQRGVYEINSEEEFQIHFEKSMSFSRKKELIVEEYVSGREMSVNTFRYNGETVFSLVTDRETWEDFPGGIIHKHIVPSLLDNDTISKIEMMTNDVMNILQINNGPAYFQVKLDSNNNPKLIEVTPRLDGCHMWKVIKYFCDVDLLDLSMQLLNGNFDKSKVVTKENGKYILEFLCEKPGNKFNRSKYNIDNAIELVWYYEDCEEIRSMNGYMEKGGFIIRGNNE